MLLTSYYYEDTKKEKSWYQSSNVFYSEFIEDENENYGDLIVTFNNGSTYKYKKVLLAPDYVMFKHGGLEGSHGKALNKHIKPKYEFEKLNNQNIDDLIKEKEKIITLKKQEQKNNTYFISGHRDITEDEFEKYKEQLKKITDSNNKALFVVGDYNGVDIMAQNYLIDVLNIETNRITVYHMSENPMNINPKIENTVGGFTTDEERDCAMTMNSEHDVAFVRTNLSLSGTAQNILRRKLLK